MAAPSPKPVMSRMAAWFQSLPKNRVGRNWALGYCCAARGYSTFGKSGSWL